MSLTFDTVRSMYASYAGTGMQLALFYASLLYLFFSKKDKDKGFFFGAYTLSFFVLSFFPITAKIIMEYCIGAEVYWRMFWLLPTTAVIAYTGVLLINQMKKKEQKYLVLLLLLAVIGLTGTNIYNSTIFSPKENNYKIPSESVLVSDLVSQDAANRGVEHKKLMTTNALIESIRQYDATITMPYGNEAIKGLTISNNNAAQIFRIMSADSKNWEALAYYAAAENCNYLAYPTQEGLSDTLATYGFTKVGNTPGYEVYYYEKNSDSLKGEWLVTQYGSAEGNQLIFYTLQNQEGRLIVIDGGWTTDADYVKSVLKSLGNHVDAWILTHPHRDHIGAFNEIYQHPGRLTIDQVYATDMADPALCMENAPWDEVEQYEVFSSLDIPQLTYLYKDDVVDLFGLTMKVFHAYEDSVDEQSNDLLNDGALLFKLESATRSMLFCTDVGKSMSDELLTQYGKELKADYIQMGHHGNGGLKKDFYENVEASIAFFDAPDWLMNDRTGTYTNLQTTYWMASNGASIYSFATTPNQVILK